MITLAHARSVVDAAIAHAEGEGIRIAAVVLDAAGHFVTGARMDGAYLSAMAIAERKAFTAANFRTATAEMCERLPDKSYQALISQADPRLAFLPGGVPIVVNGSLAGALGISGGSAAQDAAVCAAALA